MDGAENVVLFKKALQIVTPLGKDASLYAEIKMCFSGTTIYENLVNTKRTQGDFFLLLIPA